MSFAEKRSRLRRVAEIGAESPLGAPAPPPPVGPCAEPPLADWRDFTGSPLIHGDPEKSEARRARLERAMSRHDPVCYQFNLPVIVDLPPRGLARECTYAPATPPPINLLSAVLREDLAEIWDAYDAWYDFDAQDDQGHTPVYLAVRARRLSALRLLYQLGARCDPAAHLRYSLLGAAVALEEQPPEGLVDALLELGHEPAPGTSDTLHPVSVAIANGDPETIMRYLNVATSAELNQPAHGSEQDVPLAEAMRSSMALELVPLLLERGATWRITTPNGLAWPWLHAVPGMDAQTFAAILRLMPDADFAAVHDILAARVHTEPDLRDVLQCSRESRSTP